MCILCKNHGNETFLQLSAAYPLKLVMEIQIFHCADPIKYIKLSEIDFGSA